MTKQEPDPEDIEDSDPEDLFHIDPGALAALVAGATERKPSTRHPQLTQSALDAATARDREYTLRSDVPGFGLRVRPSGHKSYTFAYKRDRRLIRIRLGDPATMSLREAHHRASQLRRNIVRGTEFSLQSSPRTEAITLDEFFHQYVQFEVRPRFSTKWGKETERYYERFVRGWIGHLLITEISLSDLMECILLADTTSTQAKTRAVLSSLYSWGVATGDVEYNPLAGTRKAIRPAPTKAPIPNETDEEVIL